MATVNDKIFDRIVDHMTDVRLYENGVQKQNRAILKKHRKNLRDILVKDIRGDVKPEVTRFGKELLGHNTKSLSEFSKSQLSFHSNNIDAEIKKFYRTNKPKTKELLAEISGPNIKGVRKVSSNISNISSGELVRIQSKVKAGLAKGLSKNEIIADVMKTTKITEHQAKTLTRTSITSTQTQALNQVMDANSEVLEGYMFTAILDARTSPICSHHNGRVYKLDEMQYRPPLHWNCRSSMVPVVKSKEQLDAVKSKNIKERGLKNMQSADLDGNPSRIKTFGEWLRRQPTDTQSKILGGERQATLFQKGRLRAEEFVSPEGKALSIRGLMRRANTTVRRPTASNISNTTLRFNTPNELMSSKSNTQALKDFFKADAAENAQSLSLVDYKGNSLAQKQSARRYFKNDRKGAAFSSDGTDYNSGPYKHLQAPDPEFLAERLERLSFEQYNLTPKQQSYIRSFVNDLDRSLSINQRAAVTDVMRQTFSRANKTGEIWEQPVSVFRKFMLNAVQDNGTSLFNRSVERGKMFGPLGSRLADDPDVFILNRKYTISQIVEDQLRDNRYIETWRGKQGAKLARRAYYNRSAPISAYTQPIIKRYPSIKNAKRALLNKIPGYKQWQAINKLLEPKGPSDSWITQQIAKLRGTARELLDGEFLFAINRKKAIRNLNDKSTSALAKSMEAIAQADGADYDQLAIKIGQIFDQELGNLNPFRSKTLGEFHKDGSKILANLEKQKLIRTDIFRDSGTSSPIDIVTGRPAADKTLRGTSVFKQIQIIDGDLRQLQIAHAKTRAARRFGVYNNRDKVYARAGQKEYYDARGRKTKMPVVSEKVYPDYDPKQIDREMAQMLNHANSVKYQVDNDFFDFAEEVIYFKAKRAGDSKLLEQNEWKKLFIDARGNDGRGVLATAKFHRQRNQSFSVDASIDFRGRVYHRGLLTPTKGETVRPFLNTAKGVSITPNAVEELMTQIGAATGAATEVLTVKGRLKSFKAIEQDLLELGGYMLDKPSQRAGQVRKFIAKTHQMGLDDEHIGKVSRLALEYTRIYRHMDGKMFTDKSKWSSTDIKKLAQYKTKVMIENDASSSGAQIIALSTKDRAAADLSNVVQTPSKQRLYDEIAKRTVNDPEFLAIPELAELDLDWSDLMKAAKNQNMVTFYGAGDATKANNVSNAFAKVLASKGKVTISAKEVDKFKKAIDAKISFEMDRKNWARIDELRDIKKNVILASKDGKPITESLHDIAKAEFRDGIKSSEEMHTFLYKLKDETGDLVGTRVFEKVSKIMTRYLEEEVPVTGKFIKFWKDVAKDYVAESGSVDIPWVTFDGKTMMQRYRVKEQVRIDFTDPVTGQKVFNIYETPSRDGKLLSQQSIQDAAIGLGVNGNHSNDAVLVRRFHLWGRKNNVDTGTIHDAFFTNLGDAVNAKFALRQLYADALKSGTIEQTLKAMRDSGMSRATYRKYVQRAKQDGLLKSGPEALTYREILEPIKDGNDWYGIGP
jgi:SPP1 gp7 family putative phage head morphogenesis protein